MILWIIMLSRYTRYNIILAINNFSQSLRENLRYIFYVENDI